MLKINGRFKNILIIFIILLLFFISLRFFLLYKEGIKRNIAELKQKPPIEKPLPTPEREKKITRKIIPPEEKKLPAPEMVMPRIAIIIDDVGYQSENIDEFLNFKGKLTFSILPFLENSSSYARKINIMGFEVMIHIPMDPVDNRNHNPGPGAILRYDSPDIIKYKLEKMVDNIPSAKGANNHMGSYITAREIQIKAVLTYLQKRKLYFIDSLTTPKSLGYEIGSDLGMRVSKRDVFIDNEDDYNKILLQLNKLKQIAKKRGYAVGIGHIQKKYTIRVLEDILPELEKESFELVFVSELFKKPPN